MNLAWADGGIAIGWQGIEPQVAQKCGGERRQSITGSYGIDHRHPWERACSGRRSDDEPESAVGVSGFPRHR
ncbi:hypothetical protein [Pseudomonas sp. PSB11]|uniref:hypothetical protein n=1 Tax=Pseudomonas sp. PSB11 TaxID=2021969 RepID=UPI0016600F62|nr:hypothetical protein [Pseudomonas sp. PSB11]